MRWISTDLGLWKCVGCHGNSCSWYCVVWIIFMVNYECCTDNSIKWHWYLSMFVKVIGHNMRARFLETQCTFRLLVALTVECVLLDAAAWELRIWKQTMFLWRETDSQLLFKFNSWHWQNVILRDFLPVQRAVQAVIHEDIACPSRLTTVCHSVTSVTETSCFTIYAQTLSRYDAIILIVCVAVITWMSNKYY